MGAVQLVPLVHFQPVDPGALVHRDRRDPHGPCVDALPRLEPAAAVDDPPRPPVHRPSGGASLPGRRVRVAVLRGLVRGHRPQCGFQRHVGQLARGAAAAAHSTGALRRRPRPRAQHRSSPWVVGTARLARGSGQRLRARLRDDRRHDQPQPQLLHPARRALPHLHPARVLGGQDGWSRSAAPCYG